MTVSRVLDNGLVVHVVSKPAPVTAVYLWVDAGTLDEDDDTRGAAHLLEHMLFKGTATRGVGQAAGEIEALGGDLNAWTSHDHTVLHATVDSGAWPQAMDVLADMALCSAIDPEELDRERLVVLEEIRSYADDPDTLVHEALSRGLFGEHGLGLPVLGTIDSVSGISAAELRGFWKRTWRADRSRLVVCGPVEADAVDNLARDLFGDWEAGTSARSLPKPRPPASAAAQAAAAQHDTQLLELGWRAPAIGHPDLAALEVLSAALGRGAASMLSRRLQLDAGLVVDSWSDLELSPVQSTLAIGLVPIAGKSTEAAELVLSSVDELCRWGLPGSVVVRARDAVLHDLLFHEETVDSVASDVAWYSARTGSHEGRAAWRAALAAVRPEDVRRVARTWMSIDRCQAVVGGRTANVKGVGEALTRAALGGSSRPTPSLAEAEISGVRVVVQRTDSPLAAVRLCALGGALHESPRTAGTAAAWAQMVTTGAGHRDTEAFAEAADSIGAVIEGSCGRNSTSLSASFPAAYLEDALELLSDALIDPHFDDDEWARVRDEMREDRRTLLDRPSEVASQKVWSSLWPRHPWRLPARGTVATLGRIGVRRLRTWHHQLLSRPGLVVSVAGGVDPDHVLSRLEECLGDLEESAGVQPRQTPRPPTSGRRVVQAGREQASIILAMRGLGLHDPGRHALSVAAALLGGQGGRLFLDLREKRGLAYDVWAHSTEGIDGGVFQIGLATHPDREVEAAGALREALVRLRTEGPTEEEVRRYVRMLNGHTAMSAQRVSWRAAAAGLGTLYGIPWGLEATRGALSAVTRQGVMDALERVNPSGALELVVRPREA